MYRVRKSKRRWREPPAAWPLEPLQIPIIALALLAGGREIAEIVRVVTTLIEMQRQRLGQPIEKGTKRFYQVPGHDVFIQVLARMNPEAFATRHTGRLQQHHRLLPPAWRPMAR